MTSMQRYALLLPVAQLQAADQAALTARFNAVVDDDTQVGRAAFNAELTRILEAHSKRAMDLLLDDMGIKFLAQGLTNQKLVELVRTQERKGKSLGDILVALDAAEQNTQKRSAHGEAVKSTIPVINNVHEVDGEEDGDFSEGEIELVRAHRRQKGQLKDKNGKKKKNFPKKQDGATNGTSNGAAGKTHPPQNGARSKRDDLRHNKEGELYYCQWCKARVGHVMKHCPQFAKHRDSPQGHLPGVNEVDGEAKPGTAEELRAYFGTSGNANGGEQ
jgi:hypothetical protein